MSTFDPRPAPLPDRRVKVGHLVFGLLFLGLAGVWAMAETGVITAGSVPLIAPAVLIVAGVLGLVASLVNARSRRGYDAPPPYGTDTSPEPTESWHEADDTTPTEEIR